MNKILVRVFVVVMVVATGGLTGAVIGGSRSAAPRNEAAPPTTSATPLVVFPGDAPGVRDAIVTVCGGRPLVGSLNAKDRDRVDRLLTDRARHAAALAGNPLTSGSGTAAGVDDALHIQALDRDIAAVLCPASS